MENNFNISQLKFSFDLSKAKYELDVLQNRILEFYIRADPRFRRAFYTNFTGDFLQYLKDKAKLKEPHHLSVMGNVRCQPKGSKILMANGEWKNIEDIKINDEVLSPNFNGINKFSKVIGISQYLSKENYDIIQKNGKKSKLYSCSSNHIIPIFFRGTLRLNKKDSNSKRKANWYYTEKEAKTLYKKKLRSYLLISSFPIQKFKGRKNCEINPYFLGFYLGDGHFTQCMGITNSNKKLLNKCSKIYKPLRVDIKKKIKNYYKKTFCYTYSIYSKPSKLLIKYGLKNKKSADKFIPKEALFSDIKYRRRLLAGLIDSDGTLSKQCAYSITTKSKKLSENILFLIRSLGGNGKIVSITKTIKSIKFKGNYYKISFYLGSGIEKIPLINDNKIRKSKKSYWKLSANRISFDIKKSFSSMVYGIELDNPSKLYITDNMIVTHNSGKSYVSISLTVLSMALQNKIFTKDYICGNAYEFVEKLKVMPEEALKNTTFLIDEQKNAVFGVGSVARKMKLEDVQNIIAINNISTIMLTPTGWANKSADYGLRTFGRCFNTKTVRLMLYNLQESGSNSERPMGMIYLPIFTSFLPKDYADKLEKDYLSKKNEWVMGEMRGEGDALAEIKRKTAESFNRDDRFCNLITKKDRLTYISQKLGSEWTTGEIESIESIAKLLKEGFLDNE